MTYDPELERRLKTTKWSSLAPSDRGPTAEAIMRQAERDYWGTRALQSIAERRVGPLDVVLSAFVPKGEIQIRQNRRIAGRITGIGVTLARQEELKCMGVNPDK